MKEKESKKEENSKSSENGDIETSEVSIPINTGSIGIFAVIILIAVGVSLRISEKRFSAEINNIKKQHMMSPKTESKKVSRIKKRMSIISKELSFEKKSSENQIKQIVLAKEEIDNKDDQVRLLQKEMVNKTEQIRLLQESQDSKNGVIKLLRARNTKIRQKFANHIMKHNN